MLDGSVLTVIYTVWFFLPVIIKHSWWPRASVKSRETISSGLIRKRISSWTRPELVTPPPTNAFAKSTCKSTQMNEKQQRLLIFAFPDQSCHKCSVSFYSPGTLMSFEQAGKVYFFTCDRKSDKWIGRAAWGSDITSTSVPFTKMSSTQEKHFGAPLPEANIKTTVKEHYLLVTTLC